MKKVILIATLLVLSVSTFADCRKVNEEKRTAISKSLCTLYKKMKPLDSRFNLEDCKSKATVSSCSDNSYVVVKFKRTNGQAVDCNAYLNADKTDILPAIDCADE